MTVLLYAVTDAQPTLPSGHGLSGRPLRAIDEGVLRAVVSDHDTPPESDTNTFLAYEAVMEHLMKQGTVIPARFGTTAEGDEQIIRLLLDRQAELGRVLERVAGAVELAVHLPEPEGDATGSPAQSGTDYLHARLEERRRGEALNQALAGLYRDSAPNPHSTAYLVDTGDVARFAQTVTDLGATVTGPWPPYSFAEGAA